MLIIMCGWANTRVICLNRMAMVIYRCRVSTSVICLDRIAMGINRDGTTTWLI